MPIQPVGAHMRRFFLLTFLSLLATHYACAQEVGTVTLMKDSPLRVIRGYSVLRGAEGMRLRQGDILETGPAPTAQAQLEFTGGAIIELGPGSQVFLFRQSGSAADIVLLSGWLKGETSSGSYRYSSALEAVTTKGANILLHASGDVSEIFVEHGAASVTSSNSAAVATSSDKVFFTRRAGKPMMVVGRPSQDFIHAMPVSFRDILPSRLSRFSTVKPAVAKSDHDVSYPEIERWLTSSWGNGLVERFRPRIQDRAFRQAIETHLAALPGWKPILHPQ